MVGCFEGSNARAGFVRNPEFREETVGLDPSLKELVTAMRADRVSDCEEMVARGSSNVVGVTHFAGASFCKCHWTVPVTIPFVLHRVK